MLHLPCPTSSLRKIRSVPTATNHQVRSRRKSAEVMWVQGTAVCCSTQRAATSSVICWSWPVLSILSCKVACSCRLLWLLGVGQYRLSEPKLHLLLVCSNAQYCVCRHADMLCRYSSIDTAVFVASCSCQVMQSILSHETIL